MEPRQLRPFVLPRLPVVRYFRRAVLFSGGVIIMMRDDDPRWDAHSGGNGHRGTEWDSGDGARATAFYESLTGNAKVILDLMIDRPGESLDADWLADQLRPPAPGDTQQRRRLLVSGSLSALRRPYVKSGRRYPFYWWQGTRGEPTRYAMKPSVANLFRAAREGRAHL